MRSWQSILAASDAYEAHLIARGRLPRLPAVGNRDESSGSPEKSRPDLGDELGPGPPGRRGKPLAVGRRQSAHLLPRVRAPGQGGGPKGRRLGSCFGATRVLARSSLCYSSCECVCMCSGAVPGTSQQGTVSNSVSHHFYVLYLKGAAAGARVSSTVATRTRRRGNHPPRTRPETR